MENKNICPKTWMLQSFIATIVCCAPFGIIGIINACAVSSAFADGNYELAWEKSLTAKKWLKRAFWCGVIIWILIFIFCGLFAYRFSKINGGIN